MNDPHADKIIIGIIGMDDHGPDEPIPQNALVASEDVGRLVAERGGILITCGRGGIWKQPLVALAWLVGLWLVCYRACPRPKPIAM